jgi:hypothetical protein
MTQQIIVFKSESDDLDNLLSGRASARCICILEQATQTTGMNTIEQFC